MGSGHAHAAEAVPLRIDRLPRMLVIGAIALAGLAAVLGVLHWWPDQAREDRVQGLIPFAAPGYTLVHARLRTVLPACTGTEQTERCGDTRATVLDGERAGRTVSISLNPGVVRSGLRPGDRVLLFDGTDAAQQADTKGVAGVDQSAFSFYRADRGPALLVLAALFAIAVGAVAGRRGLLALVSLGFAGAVVVGFLIPALLSGRPAVPVALAAAALILVVMLYLTHGPSMRTSVALVGALIGVGLSTVFAVAGVVGARLAGIGDDSAALLTSSVPWIDVQQLLVASVILAGIGTLNDVTVTQASALWELRAAAPALGRWDLFRRAMRIGRDHVASTVYTLVFAYLGTALVLLVAVQLYGGGAADFLTADDVAEEVVRVLVGGVALVLAMPVTTAIGALVVGSASPEEPAEEQSAPFRPRPAVRTQPHDELRRFPEDPWRT